MLAVLLSFSNIATAKDLGVHGTIFEIKETNLLDLIRTKLHAMEASGEISLQQERMKEQAIATMETPPPVRGLSKTTEERSFYFDPSMVLQEDLADQEGRVFATAGTHVNPFDHISLSKQLLFIQGSDPEQVDWAFETQNRVNGRAKIIFVDGKPLEVMRQHKKPVFFDQRGYLTSYFGIQQVPAIVQQEDKTLRIDEVLP